MKKCISTLIKDKKELWDSILLTLTLMAMFLIFALSTLKDLPFIYNQF
ncbi:hypothetical protein H7E67_11855 [Clostridium gasigenes]|nr:hypothetical protein [Clostridium gasigenes]MBB6624124.1 hypothetical protein [Clostridium gasigenes]